MTSLLLTLCAVLHLAFAGVVADLDAPEFAKRRTAKRVLIRWYPLSDPACREAARTTPSVQLRDAAESVIRPADELAWLLTEDGWLYSLIADPEEADGLQWLSLKKYEHRKWDTKARDAMLRVVNSMRSKGYFEGGAFYCELPDDHVRRHSTFEGYLAGINNLRFAVRGLPDPQFARSHANIRMAWAWRKVLIATGREKWPALVEYAAAVWKLFCFHHLAKPC